MGGGSKGGGSKGGGSKGGGSKGGEHEEWGARREARRVGGLKGASPKGGGPEGGRPKISRFFPCPAAKFVLFFPLWGSSRGILVVF